MCINIKPVTFSILSKPLKEMPNNRNAIAPQYTLFWQWCLNKDRHLFISLSEMSGVSS